MSADEHLQLLADEFNARAKAEGRYLEQEFWEIPSQPGSIFDVPETPESRERVARLRAQIAELNVELVENGATPVQRILADVNAAVEHVRGETTER